MVEEEDEQSTYSIRVENADELHYASEKAKDLLETGVGFTSSNMSNYHGESNTDSDLYTSN